MLHVKHVITTIHSSGNGIQLNLVRLSWSCFLIFAVWRERAVTHLVTALV